MNRSKLVAIITGVISILLAIAYLIIVQLLDLRGEMIPAPVSQLSPRVDVALAETASPTQQLRGGTHRGADFGVSAQSNAEYPQEISVGRSLKHLDYRSMDGVE